MNDNDEKEHALYQSMIAALHHIRDSKSPPKAQVDEASLQLAMDKNKESLKMKLMNRRPINQLVDQGIIPSPKVPPHYYEQRQKLERAKMGDFLKNKIQKRPDRQALIQQHILEDTKIDPSLQDKQRQLKKARLADDLNDRLSHRPGPLELVKGNILQADEKFAQAVKEGQIQFKRTCEGQALRHPMPCFTFEDDSGSDAALSPPQDLLDQSLNSMPSVETMVLSPYQNQDSPSNSLGELRISSGTPPTSTPSPVSSQSGISLTSEIVPKENTTVVRRKKSKPKAQPKPRTIKFHEYKGPPNAQKSQASLLESETSYELLLQQQQLFLQWQLEWQQKYPHQMILPVPQQPSSDQSKSANVSQSSLLDKQLDSPSSPSQNSMKQFEDMKVNSLKAELKKRNLPVSGSKVQLLERLKNHLELTANGNKSSDKNNVKVEATTVPINVNGIILDTLPTLVTQPDAMTSVVTVEPINNRTSQISVKEEPTLMVYNTLPVQGQLVASRPSSAAPMDVEINNSCDAMDCSDGSNIINDDIVKRQQQKILQLQRELQRSQMQLQQQQWLQQQQQAQAQQQALLASHPVPIAPAPPANQIPTLSLASLPHQGNVDKALKQLQQHIHQKIQQQQLIQQAGKYAPGSAAKSAIVKANLAAHIHNQQANSIRLPNGIDTLNQQNITQYANLKPIVLCQAQAVPQILEKPRANSVPNGLAQQKLVWSTSVPNFSNLVPKMTLRTVEPKLLIQKAPPDYSEAVKPQNKVKQEKQSNTKNRKKSVKSQEVDDVLGVLIKNGELPPSAALEPVTPTTPETQKNVPLGPPLFPTIIDVKSVRVEPESSEAEQKSTSLPIKIENYTSQQEGVPNLVFDLNVDLQDLGMMDLGVLENNDSLDSPTQMPFSKPESLHESLHQQQSVQNTLSGDVDMDVDISEWLDMFTNNNTVANSNQPRSVSYNSDPLLSSMDNGQETFDMFSLDNDFRTPSDTFY
ncbi:myocardin-related transcription factor A [Parasteatoda tepidariorum]|nr:myocardin-related transcription factor A [Parasteatoda tepidariorum]XP_015906590.1 myocardin-related transcription factor A [Parasteatoda tepidariorum]